MSMMTSLPRISTTTPRTTSSSRRPRVSPCRAAMTSWPSSVPSSMYPESSTVMRPICLEPRPLMIDSNLDMKSTSFGCAHALVVRWNPGTCVRQNAQVIAEKAQLPGNVMGGAAYHGAMCLIAFRWQPDGPVPLVVAANRDEFYDRSSAPLAWWEGGRILAGQDLWSGGTWMGVSRDGR